MRKLFLFLLGIFLTQCGDLVYAEYSTGFTPEKGFEKKANIAPNHLIKIKPKLGLPASFDWRTKVLGGLTPVRDQANCGSCAFFASTNTASDLMKILYPNGNKIYAPQYALSCNDEGWNCQVGAWWPNDWYTVNGKGLKAHVLESDFPYTASDSECKSDLPKSDSQMFWKFIDSYDEKTGEYRVPSDSVLQTSLIEFGPLNIAFFVGPKFQQYRSGIFTQCEEGEPNHAVELVGYGTDANVGLYYIVKNSWGSSWGEQGYFRIKAGGCSKFGYSANIIQFDKKPNTEPDGDDCDPEPNPDPEPPTPPTPPCTPEAKADAWPYDSYPRDYGRGIVLGSPKIDGASYLWTDRYGRRLASSAKFVTRVFFTTQFNLYVRTKCGEARDSVVVRGIYRDKDSGKKYYFMPQNNMHLFDNKENSLGITQEEFEAVIVEFEKAYTPIFQKFGLQLAVIREWDNPEVNAYTYQQNGISYIHLFGGLARRTEITRDGFAYVLAHEASHNIGGMPSDGRMSFEGQSDYASAHAVMKQLWKYQDNSSYKKMAPNTVVDACNKAFHCLPKAQELCARIALAGKSGADLLGALNNESVSFDTPSTVVVDRTMEEHPPAQCRLDTVFAGAQCQIPWNDSVIPQTESESLKYQCNNRPRCWFKPTITRL